MSKFKKSVSIRVLVATSVVLTVSVEARAQTTTAPGCFIAPAKLADAEIVAFSGAPSALLTEFSYGGLPMVTRVRSLAGSSADSIDPLLSLVSPGMDERQLAAIGGGLGRATRACAPSNLEYATLIQTRVALLNNPALTAAFLAGSGETQTASVAGASAAGGGNAAGAAGIGEGGTAGGGSAGVDGSEFAATQSGNFDVSVSRGSVSITTINNGSSGLFPTPISP